MTAFTAVLLVAIAVLALPPRARHRARARLAVTLPRVRESPRPAVVPRVPASPRVAAFVGGAATALVLGGPTGVVAGAAATVLLGRWLRGLEPRSQRMRRRRLEADLPVAADLLAACLYAGSPLADAAEVTGGAVGGPLGEELQAVVTHLRLGGDPAHSWLALTRDPPLAAFGRALARAADSGAPVADAVRLLADEQRVVRRWAAEAEARRAGVRATAPLGLCFLPAFVATGVLPVILGAASDVLG
ncbi:MAG: type II secretion system F family protein [Carbonactinosporaceae bacterium]